MKNNISMILVAILFVSLPGCGMSKARKDLIKLYSAGTREITQATQMLKDAKTTTDAAKAVDKGSVIIKDVAKKETAILETNPVPATDDLKRAQEKYLEAANIMKQEISKIPTRFARDKILIEALKRAQE